MWRRWGGRVLAFAGRCESAPRQSAAPCSRNPPRSAGHDLAALTSHLAHTASRSGFPARICNGFHLGEHGAPAFIASCLLSIGYKQVAWQEDCADKAEAASQMRYWKTLLVTLFASCYWTGAAGSTQFSASSKASLTAHEAQVWTSAKREIEFSAVPHTARGSCEATRPPEALATPNPLLDHADSKMKVRVSFIIGTDGRVYSPFILESAGPTEDRIVLNTVRAWRYRPAMCNGVPAEAEAKIGFSGR